MFDLVVRLDEEHRQSIDNLRNLFVNTPDGNQVPLKEVAEISYQPGPMQISRDNTNRRTYVGINVEGRDVKSLVEEIQQTLDEKLELPSGYYIRYGGAFENLERASKRLTLVVPLALALIFMLVFFAIKSFKQTLMIYVAIPLAAVGGIFSLYLRDMPFSISAGVGFIVLFGVAVLNGLVLISGFNELKEEGKFSLRRYYQKRFYSPVAPYFPYGIHRYTWFFTHGYFHVGRSRSATSACHCCYWRYVNIHTSDTDCVACFVQNG